MGKAVVLLSGGLDSAVAAIWVRQIYGMEVSGLYVSYGQQAMREGQYAAEFANAHNINLQLVAISGLYDGRVALTSMGAELPKSDPTSKDQKVTVVPNRNGIFIMLGVAEAIMRKAETVVTGIQIGGRALYPDNRERYLEYLDGTAHLADDPTGPHLLHPFAAVTKKQIVLEGKKLGARMDLTWSCYAGGRLHCGVCKACQTRKQAFVEAGVEDPTEYAE